MSSADLDAFEERAAIMEFDGGMTRFAAETAAAEAMGLKRHEVLDAIRERNLARGRDQRPAVARQQRAVPMPAMQPDQEEENGPMSQRDAEVGRDRLALLALRT